MTFFEHFLESKGIISSTGENKLCCPFPHKVAGDVEFYETNPSASINIDKKVFNCLSCGRGYSEYQFIENYFGCDSLGAKKISDILLRSDESLEDWDKHYDNDGLIDLELPLNDETRERAHSLGISDIAIEKMHIKTAKHPSVSNIMVFPVSIFGAIVDHRYYHPYDSTHPKTKNSKKMWVRGGCPNGLILPWGILEETPEDKVLCIAAGEKDTANLLARGLNAITITGGENQYKVLQPNMLKNRKLAILYDNDKAGVEGAEKLAAYLYSFGNKQIRVVTGHHEICVNEGEDITDFFLHYGRNADDLKRIIASTPYFTPSVELLKEINVKVEEVVRPEDLPIVDLYEATMPEYEGKLVRSVIQVLASEDIAYSYPKHAIVRKVSEAPKPSSGDWILGQYKEWRLTDRNSEDLLWLVDENFKESQIRNNVKSLVKADPKEAGIKVEIHERGAAFRATIQDFTEDKTKESKVQTYNALIFNQKLDSGKRYMVTHKVVPNPHKGGRKVMIVSEVQDAEDSVSKFEVTTPVVNNLKKFQGRTTEEMVRSFAVYVGFTPNIQMLTTIDLAFHTPLQFYLTNQFNRPQLIRGTLDTLVIGESRTGKSSSTKACVETYGLGQIISLAGKSATINGLIGGSIKVGASDRYATKAGALPMNNKGLVVLEELGKASNDLMRELTDIRSSSRVRITRVDATVDLPCMLRTIYLTNAKSKDGEIQSIESFPNGIDIVTGLVSAPEDIARFDNICIIGDKASVDYTDMENPPLNLDSDEKLAEYQDALRDRIRWIWSRTPEQIKITKEADMLLRTLCNSLNEKYETHIKIFGTELRQKVARIAVAIAGYQVSTNSEFEEIIVLPEHVAEAAEYFKNLYDNDTFKIARYVKDQRQYSEFTEEGLEVLNTAFNKVNGAALIYALDKRSVCTVNELQANTGLNREELNLMLQPLLKACLIQFSDQNKIKPTEKYRLTRPKISSTRIRPLTETWGGGDN